MIPLLNAFLDILDDSAFLILIGFGVAGLLHVVLESRADLLAPLTRRGARSVVLATLIGLPMPLCSCSVLPTALSLQKRGAGKGATSSFLITVPETDAVSVMLTWSLMGPLIAVYRPIASLVTGIVTGLAVDRVDRGAAEAGAAAAGPAPAPVAAPACGCGSGAAAKAAPSCCSSEAPDEGATCCADKSPAPGRRNRLLRAFEYGYLEFFDDLSVRLTVGLLIGAAVAAYLPSVETGALGGGWLSYLMMLGLGIPMYVCATSSTPVAAGLVAAGVSPGAALVFLLVGPATNAASMLVVARQFGRRAFAAHMAGIVALSVLLGLGLDLALSGTTVPGLDPAGHAFGHEHAGFWNRGGTIIFLALTAWSLWRRRRTLIRRTFGALSIFTAR